MRRSAFSHSFTAIAASAVLAALSALAAPPDWAFRAAPYRAIVHSVSTLNDPDFGSLVDFPESGLTRKDADDLILTDKSGKTVPVKVLGVNEGQYILLLAQGLEQAQDYYLYFGGGMSANSPRWTPKTSLLLETRRIPPNTSCNSWAAMQSLWDRAQSMDGIGFVDTIFQGDNPFGPDHDFVSHYIGYLDVPDRGSVFLYTLSSDASFVLVNGNCVLSWEGVHPPIRTQDDVKGADVPVVGIPLRIDYYQIKGSDGAEPAMVLGWKKDNKMQTVPADAWERPGTTKITSMESASGFPVPIPVVQAESCLGYGNNWYLSATYNLPGTLPVGWTATWQFDDGTQANGTQGRHVFAGQSPHTVGLTLRSGSHVLTGTRRVTFSDTLPEISVNDPNQMGSYLDAIASEVPAGEAADAANAKLLLLLDFATDTQAGPLAGAFVHVPANVSSPLSVRASEAWLWSLAQKDPSAALAELRKMDPAMRAKDAKVFGELEMDLLTFDLHDRTAAQRAMSLESEVRDADFVQLMKIRTGDLLRINGNIKGAATQYLAVAGDTDPKALPAVDSAYSMEISQMLDKNQRQEAQDKLREWELRHPMAKLDSDFLLLHARILDQFGHWREALAEIDSFSKILPDDPLQIDAMYYRALCLYHSGAKADADAIWVDLAKKYPNHPLAAAALDWSKKP